MIRLFTTVYSEINEHRRSEFRRCLELNAACDFVEEIRVLCEGDSGLLPVSDKIKCRSIAGRPTFQDYIDWQSEFVNADDVSIIANSDIYFDQQLALFTRWNLSSDTVMALSRWDATAENRFTLFDRKDSQDVWVLKGKPRALTADFPVGVPRCDNRFLHELKEAGYNVINPAFSLRAYHLHEGVRAEYQSENLSDFVDPPYAYLWPHNLWSLPRTIWHNIRHRECRVGWRLDRRKIAGSLPIRAVRKGARGLRMVLDSVLAKS